MSLTANCAPLWRIARTLAVMLALAVQIACGAVAAQGDGAGTQVSALDAATILCQAGGGHQRNDDTPLHHRLSDAAIVQAGVHVGQHVAILDGSAFVVPPCLTRAVMMGVPQARAPPAIVTAFCYPRGPPSLI